LGKFEVQQQRPEDTEPQGWAEAPGIPEKAAPVARARCITGMNVFTLAVWAASSFDINFPITDIKKAASIVVPDVPCRSSLTCEVKGRVNGGAVGANRHGRAGNAGLSRHHETDRGALLKSGAINMHRNAACVATRVRADLQTDAFATTPCVVNRRNFLRSECTVVETDLIPPTPS